jgi:SAM-dependent methyltransferase
MPYNAQVPNMYMIHGRHRSASPIGDTAAEAIATVYNQAGDDYIAYADGDAASLFAFDGPHAYADRYLWSVLDAKLRALRARGQDAIKILDAGCGPGTWLRRLVTRARDLGFTTIEARGFDVAETQIQSARLLAGDLADRPGIALRFDVADLSAPLPEAAASVDITLCLYSVLSHLPLASLPKIAEELARVTRGHFIATVRTAGSVPSIFVDSVEKASHFQHDHARNRCSIELRDGRRFSLGFHLFSVAELKHCFVDRFGIEELRGLDVFHSRFAPDPRWNPASLPFGGQCEEQLARLEETYARIPGFMERATHLLLIGRPRRCRQSNDVINMASLYAKRAPGRASRV